MADAGAGIVEYRTTADIRSRLVTPERGAGVCELWLRRGAKRLWTASLVETIAVVLGSYPG